MWNPGLHTHMCINSITCEHTYTHTQTEIINILALKMPTPKAYFSVTNVVKSLFSQEDLEVPMPFW